MHIDLFLLLLLLVRIGGQIDCVASTGDAARTSMSLARHTSVLSGRPPHLDSKRCQAAPLCPLSLSLCVSATKTRKFSLGSSSLPSFRRGSQKTKRAEAVVGRTRTRSRASTSGSLPTSKGRLKAGDARGKGGCIIRVDRRQEGSFRSMRGHFDVKMKRGEAKKSLFLQWLQLAVGRICK